MNIHHYLQQANFHLVAKLLFHFRTLYYLGIRFRFKQMYNIPRVIHTFENQFKIMYLLFCTYNYEITTK